MKGRLLGTPSSNNSGLMLVVISYCIFFNSYIHLIQERGITKYRCIDSKCDHATRPSKINHLPLDVIMYTGSGLASGLPRISTWLPNNTWWLPGTAGAVIVAFTEL